MHRVITMHTRLGQMDRHTDRQTDEHMAIARRFVLTSASCAKKVKNPALICTQSCLFPLVSSMICWYENSQNFNDFCSVYGVNFRELTFYMYEHFNFRTCVCQLDLLIVFRVVYIWTVSLCLSCHLSSWRINVSKCLWYKRAWKRSFLPSKRFAGCRACKRTISMTLLRYSVLFRLCVCSFLGKHAVAFVTTRLQI